MTEINLSTEALLSRRALAEKATPGPWGADNYGNIFACGANARPLVLMSDDINNDGDIILPNVADAAHIAANSPDVVIATIDELLRLREENARLRKEADWLAQSVANNGWISPEDMREAARKAVEEVCPKN